MNWVLQDALILAGTHVACLVGGIYLCYAILAGRLLRPKQISVGKAADAERAKYAVNRDAEPEGFVSKALKGYDLDRENYLRSGAGHIPINRPRGVNDEFSRGKSLATPGLQTPGRPKPGGVPQGTQEGNGATPQAPDRTG